MYKEASFKLLFLKCIGVSDKEYNGYTKTEQAEIDEFANYLIRTYMRMRGKDFVRRVMGRSRTIVGIGTRSLLAAKSIPGTHRDKQKPGQVDDEESDDKEDFECLQEAVRELDEEDEEDKI